MQPDLSPGEALDRLLASDGKLGLAESLDRARGRWHHRGRHASH